MRYWVSSSAHAWQTMRRVAPCVCQTTARNSRGTGLPRIRVGEMWCQSTPTSPQRKPRRSALWAATSPPLQTAAVACPAAPGICLPPSHMHGRLPAQHAPWRAKTGLHHRSAGHRSGPHNACAAALFLQPLPALRLPQLGPVVTTVIHKLDKLRPGHHLGVNSNSGTCTSCAWRSLSRKPAAAGGSQLPARGRNQQRLTHRQGPGTLRLSGKPSVWAM